MPNPFTLSPGYAKDLDRQRRERFRISVYAVLGGLGLLLVGTLIQGCRSHRTADSTAGDTTEAATNAVTTSTNLPLAEATPQTTNPPVLPGPTAELPAPSAEPAAAAAAAPAATTPTNALETPASARAVKSAGQDRYVIKRGDTLLRIAKTHHTTVKALKLANGLTKDRIRAGDVLKLPASASPGQT